MKGAWAVIPARAFGAGKTRLAPVLDAAARRRLSREWFRHVVRTVRAVVGARRVIVVSSSGEVLGLARRMGVRALEERFAGLNPAIEQATRFARELGAAKGLVLHGDLPLLGRGDVRATLSGVAEGQLALAPDRNDEGTNGLALPLKRAFRFRFGERSFRKHLSEARSRRLAVRVVRRAGFACDVDTPADYERLELP